MVLQAEGRCAGAGAGRIPRHDPDQCSALGPIGLLPGADAVLARDDNRPCRRLVGRARGRSVDGAATAILVLRRYSASSALILGAGALVAGLLGVLAGANVASPSLLLASSALAGIGFGAAYLGALGSIAPLAEPQ